MPKVKNSGILALDLGTTTGYAVLSHKGLMSGSYRLGSTKEQTALRFRRLRNLIKLHHIRSDGLATIYYEEVVSIRTHLSVRAAHLYGGFLAMIQLFCLDHPQVVFIGVPIKSIKKHMTGNGNAKKPEMLQAAASRKWVNHIRDHNEADALAILDFVLTEYYDSSISQMKNIIGTMEKEDGKTRNLITTVS